MAPNRLCVRGWWLSAEPAGPCPDTDGLLCSPWPIPGHLWDWLMAPRSSEGVSRQAPDGMLTDLGSGGGS